MGTRCPCPATPSAGCRQALPSPGAGCGPWFAPTACRHPAPPPGGPCSAGSGRSCGAQTAACVQDATQRWAERAKRTARHPVCTGSKAGFRGARVHTLICVHAARQQRVRCVQTHEPSLGPRNSLRCALKASVVCCGTHELGGRRRHNLNKDPCCTLHYTAPGSSAWEGFERARHAGMEA